MRMPMRPANARPAKGTRSAPGPSGGRRWRRRHSVHRVELRGEPQGADEIVMGPRSERPGGLVPALVHSELVVEKFPRQGSGLLSAGKV
jgi:hypothetical protein